MKNEIPIIVGNSNQIVSICEKIPKLASINVPVFIQGERGTGKDLVATNIFYHSQNAEKEFYKIDCSILEDELNYIAIQLQKETQEMFIYFDGIEKLNEYGQSLLYRAMEKNEIVIHRSSLLLKARIIASADLTIPVLVKQGLFREDLFLKLSTIKITLPSLKERKEDIPLLVHHFIKVLNTKYKKSINRISEDLTKFLLTNRWYGNVGQLKNLLEGMVALSSKRKLSLANVPKEFLSDIPTAANNDVVITPGISLEDYEKQIIKTNLEFMNGNRLQTAKILGISERNLYRKIKQYDI
ncbi:MAG: sigma-54-dependent Fis family transcriptional regulator [Leptospiraceae bacterium]|nr:sigma-54-dependent Fis family transcriptional regulator [Leptospiraceae bacterium]MCP5495827.1 sigma-54-dependent Fis family transcriptional regulator [Leptospiraceae bacterium]